MRVVQVSVFQDPQRRDPDQLFEAWPTLAAVAGAVREAGIEVSIVQAAHRDALVERGGVRFQFVGGPQPGVLRRRAGFWAQATNERVVNAVQDAKPDVIHFQSLSFPRDVRGLLNRVRRIPILLQDHADRPPARLQRLVDRAGMPMVAGAAFVHRDQALPFVRAGVLAEDVPIFEVPESSSRFVPGDRAAARAATGLYGDPCLLWVGRLDPNKDPLTILEAVERAASELPDLTLWCCYTEAPLLSQVEEVLSKSPLLAARVHLLGRVPHERVQELCRAADFFVLGSQREGSGYALMEAMACGLTPVVTDIPSFRRMTGDGRVGALYPPGDGARAAALLVELDRGDRANQARSVRAHFERHLSFEAVGRALAGAYRAVAGSP